MPFEGGGGIIAAGENLDLEPPGKSEQMRTVGLPARRVNTGESSPDIVISRYSQIWKLMTLVDFNSDSQSGKRIIRTRMEIDFAVTDNEEQSTGFQTAYKSIALSYMDVKDVSVVEYKSRQDRLTDTNAIPLKFRVEKYPNRTPYYFLTWEFHQLLTSFSSIVVTYDLYDPLCSTDVSQEQENECSSPGSQCMLCGEKFSAPWANQWKNVPVFNATYQFLTETDSWNSPNVGTSSENNQIISSYHDLELGCSSTTEDPSCDSSFCEVQTFGYKNSTSMVMTCEVLDRQSTVSPEQPTFQWLLRHKYYPSESNSTNFNSGSNPDDFRWDFEPICASACYSDQYSFAMFGNLVVIFAIVIGLVVIANRCKRGREGTRRGTGRSPETNIQILTNLAMNGPRPVVGLTNQERMKKEREVLDLPLISYGTTDEEVEAKLRSYHTTRHKNASLNIEGGGNENGEEVEEIQMQGHSSYQQQLVACAACMSCSICICEFNRGEKVRILPQCGHLFHHECIWKWLVEQNSSFCPLCQQEVISK